MGIDFQEETKTLVIDSPSESSVRISPHEQPHIKAHDIIKARGVRRKIEKTGDTTTDWRYKLGYATCLVSPWTKARIGEKEMLVRVVEELAPGLNSNIEPIGFSIRQCNIVNETTNQSPEETVVFIEDGKIEDGKGQEASAEQMNAAMELLSQIGESTVETSSRATDSNSSELVRMRHFYRPEGARPLSVSP